MFLIKIIIFLVLAFTYLFFFEKRGKKKNDIFLFLYLGILFVIFTSLWQATLPEFYFLLTFTLLIAVFRAGLYSLALLIFQLGYSALFLGSVISFPAYGVIIVGTVATIGFIRIFSYDQSEKTYGKPGDDGSEVSGDYEETFLKKIEMNVKSKMDLVSTMDEEILFFHYLLKKNRLVIGYSNHKSLMKSDIPWESVPFLKELILSAKISRVDRPEENIRKYGLFLKDVIINGMIIKPFLNGDRVEGIMGFATSHSERFQQYLPFYERYLDDMAEYFQSRRIYRKLLKEKNEFLFFYNALSKMNQSRSLNDISDNFLNSFKKMFSVNIYSFLEVAEDSYRVISSTSKECITDKWFAVPQGSYLLPLMKKPELRIVNIGDKRRIKLNISGSVESMFNSGIFIAIPIQTSVSNPYVILLELKSKHLTSNEKKMISILSDNLQHIIENMALLERFSNLANYDGLTEIYNHKKFQELFQETLDHSKSPRRDLCVVMLDIDHFKLFNDTYGHKTGDLVLKKVARSMEKSIKDNDVVARYGGEEFIVLIRDSDIETGMSVAERIRKNIESIRLDIGSEVIRITISGGLSHYPSMGLDRSTLIEKADKALYASKEKGRNQVSIFD